jgi:hypothetical protein
VPDKYSWLQLKTFALNVGFPPFADFLAGSSALASRSNSRHTIASIDWTSGPHQASVREDGMPDCSL